MRIIVTGGTGLIGKPLTGTLAAAGHEVTVLTRNPSAVAPRLAAGVRTHAWDARTSEGWAHLIDGADAVIHLAGENIAGTGFLPSRWTPARKRLIAESRIQSGLALVEAIEAAETKPRVFIQASAVGYYGVHGDEVIDESHGPGADFLSSVCVSWEESTQPLEEMGVRRVIARTGNVLSMDGGSLPFSVLQFRLFAGGRLGSGDQYFSWIHIEDEVAALRFLLEHEEAQGPFNLTAPNPVTNREFTRTLGRVLNRPSFLFVPETLLRLVLGEISTLVLDGQRVVPSRLLELGFKFRFPELFYALRDLL
ncbi:MAG: TIGR01777 family protein [Caldilineae bacterium]|nr:MAG: TIGR01777 family protein [Caldilineae bacterium]